MIGTKLLNRYQILRELGRGGMGIVYLAQDPLLEREVAVKVLPQNLLSAQAQERFKREALIVAGMDHPAVVAVHDIGEEEGYLFFVMPYVRGTNLRYFLNDGSLSLDDVLEIGIQTAEAIEYSHSNGIVHRDIKPENIMVTRETEIRVRITDFGLAMISSQERITKTGAVVGTLSYLSPEQIGDAEIDGRADIYSLGTVLYECLTGTAPFSGEIQAVVYRIAHEIPQRPRSLGADIREDLELLVMQCLEKHPDRRPQRAGDVARSLREHRSKLQQSDRVKRISSGHKATLQHARPPMPALIGRDKEFAELQRMLNAALAGECQFAVVAGEPGIGKSRLLEELEKLAKARRIAVLHGRCIEKDQAFPYQCFCETIQEYFRSKVSPLSPGEFSDLASDLTSLFPVLTEIKDLRSDATSAARILAVPEGKKFESRTTIFDLLARTLIRMAAGSPLVLLLEDLHAAEVSIQALQYIVRRLSVTPTLIVATYRTTEVAKNHPMIKMLDAFQRDRRFSLIRLDPLLPSEHRAFLETAIGSSDLEDRLVEKLYEGTEGNLYFTRELVKALVDSGRIFRTESGMWNLSGETAISSESLPATIQQTVKKRIQGLPKNLRETLSLASILGRGFDLRDLVLLGGVKEKVEKILERLIEESLLEEDRESQSDRFLFQSNIVREVVYAQLSRQKRKSLHRTYAEELEKRNLGSLEQIYPQLVHHYSLADVPEKVIEYGFRLATKSLDAFSANDAVNAATTVLEFLKADEVENPSLEAETRMLLAAGYRMSGNIEPALQELEEAIKIFQRERDKGRLVSAMVTAAETAWEGRKVEAAKHWIEKGIPAARVVERTGSLLTLLSLGTTVANLGGDHEKAKQYLEEVERLLPETKERKEEVVQGGELVVAFSVAVEATHPAEIELDEELEIFANVYETLVTTDKHGNQLPWLCENWEVLDQGKFFLFTLRQNIRMHDGRILTPELAKESLETSIRISRNRLLPAFVPVCGVTEYLDGSAKDVAGITVPSRNKLGIRLTKSLPVYPAFLSDGSTAVALQIEDDGEKESRLSGTGPFQLASIKPHGVRLVRNPDYWKGASSYLDAIEFKGGLSAAEIASGLRSGEFDLARDLAPEHLEELLRDRRLRSGLVEAAKKNTYFVLFNSSSPLVQMPQVRQALCGVVPAQDLVHGTIGRFAQPAEGFLPPGILGHDPGRRRRTPAPEKVTELLQSLSGSLPGRLKASVHPILQDRYASLMESLLRIWAGIGVQISIETADLTSYLDTWSKNEEIDLWIGRYVADYDDPDNFTHELFHSKTGHLRNYCSSKELDRLMEEARTESRPAAREKLYRKIENLLLESGLILPLFHEIDCRVGGPKVRGLALQSSPPYVNYAEISKAPASDPGVFMKMGGGLIHIPISERIQNLDPALAVTTGQQEVIPTIFQTLTHEKEGARIVPYLASWFLSEEGNRKFRFHLREGVRFHDGRKLTSRDVRYSFERLLLNRQSKHRWLLSPIVGAKELLNDKVAELEGFRIVSASEFAVDLETPAPLFPALLSHHSLAIVPEGTQQLSGNWREGCAGTGPFRIVQFDPGRRLELEPNPYYWHPGRPKSDRLVFYFGVPAKDILDGFLTGRFSLAWDLLPPDVEALRHRSEFASRYRESPQLSTCMVVFDIHQGPLSDEKLRSRLIETVDVNTLVRRTLSRLAIPASSLIPPGLLGYEPGHQRNAPSASVTTGLRQTPERTDIQLCCSIHPIYEGPYAALAKELFKTFGERGIRIHMIQEPSESATASDSTHMELTRHLAGYPDADTFVSSLHSQSGSFGRLCGTPEIDRLIEEGRRETDPQVRHNTYREIEEIIRQRALLLPLFHEQVYRFARPDVEGFPATLTQTFDYENLWIWRR